MGIEPIWLSAVTGRRPRLCSPTDHIPEFVTGVSGSSTGDTAASHSLLALCGGQKRFEVQILLIILGSVQWLPTNTSRLQTLHFFNSLPVNVILIIWQHFRVIFLGFSTQVRNYNVLQSPKRLWFILHKRETGMLIWANSRTKPFKNMVCYYAKGKSSLTISGVPFYYPLYFHRASSHSLADGCF